MSTLDNLSVTIQITTESRPSTPTFLAEVTAFAQVLTHTGILKKIQDQVRFARARFGQYDLIDFVVVLIGYVVSGVTLTHFDGKVKASGILFPKEGKDHEKSPKDLYPRV